MTRRKKEEVSYLAEAGQNIAQTQPNLDLEKIRKDYLKIVCLQKKQKDNLLGGFSSDGKYIFENNELIQSLLSIPKHLDEKDEDVYYASAKLGTFVLNFKVAFEMDSSFCKSEIYLIETEETTEESVKHLTKLDEDESVYQTLYKEEMLKRWNIYRDEDYIQKEEDEKRIFDYLSAQEKDRNFSKELVEILSQLYVLRVLSALDNCGELGQKLKSEYKLLIEKIMKNDPSISQDFTRMKAILDEIIQKNNALDEIIKNPEVAKAMETFSSPIMRMLDKESVAIKEPAQIKKEDKAPEKKSEPSSPKKSKPKSKAKSGGGKSKDSGGGKKKSKDDKKKESKGPPLPPIKIEPIKPIIKQNAKGQEKTDENIDIFTIKPESLNEFKEENLAGIIKPNEANGATAQAKPEDVVAEVQKNQNENTFSNEVQKRPSGKIEKSAKEVSREL